MLSCAILEGIYLLSIKYMKWIIKGILWTALLLSFLANVSAVAPTGWYLPWDTIDPDCVVWDVDCFVKNVWVETDPLRKFVEWSGSLNAVYTGWKVWIGTNNPISDFHIVDTVTNDETLYIWWHANGQVIDENAIGFTTWNNWSNYIDLKTETWGKSYFRTWYWVETGAQRTWMTVDPVTAFVWIWDTSPITKLEVSWWDATINGLTVWRWPMNNVYSTVLWRNAYTLWTGHYNVAVWAEALENSTTWAWNTAVWWLRTLEDNVTGSRHTAIGMYALRNNIDWLSNTALWYDAMQWTTWWNYNIGIWYRTLGTIWTWSNNNTWLGASAWRLFKAWTNNVFLWARSGDLFWTWSSNIAIGAFSNLWLREWDNQLAIWKGIFWTEINSSTNSKIWIWTATPTEKLEVEGVIKAWFSPTAGNVMIKDGYWNGSLFTLWNHYSSWWAVLWFWAQPKNWSAWYVASTWINIWRNVMYMHNAWIDFLTEWVSVKAIWDDITPTSKLFIKNDWKVWVGTNNPLSNLHVDSSATNLRLSDNDSIKDTDGHYARLVMSDSNNAITWWLWFATTGQKMSISNLNTGTGASIWFTTAWIERMEIWKDGKVWIWTSDPTALLDIKSSGTTDGAQLNFHNNWGGAGAFLWQMWTAHSIWPDALVIWVQSGVTGMSLYQWASDFAVQRCPIWVSTTSACNSLFIKWSNWNVWIWGTTNPTQKLEVWWGIKVANVTTCDVNAEWTIKYNAGQFQWCDGTNWIDLH